MVAVALVADAFDAFRDEAKVGEAEFARTAGTTDMMMGGLICWGLGTRGTLILTAVCRSWAAAGREG